MNDTSNIDLLDSTLDDLADLPEFKIFPNGAHRCTISFEEKTVNDHPSVEVKLRVLETVELANSGDDPLAPGDEGSILYMLDNEFGQGGLKALLQPLGAATGFSRLRQIMEAASGMTVKVVTKRRQNKEKTATYLSITSIQVE